MEAMMQSLLEQDSQTFTTWFENTCKIYKMDKVTFSNKRQILLDKKFVVKSGKFYSLKVTRDNVHSIDLYSSWLDKIGKQIPRSLKKTDHKMLWHLIEQCLYVNQRLTLFLACSRPYMTKGEEMKTKKEMDRLVMILRTIFENKEKISRREALRFETYIAAKMLKPHRSSWKF